MSKNLYFIKPKIYTLLEIEILNKRLKTSYSNKAYLWCLKLNHINQERIIKFVKDDTLNLLKILIVHNKMTKCSFNSKNNN